MPRSGLSTGCNLAAVECMKGEAERLEIRVPVCHSRGALPPWRHACRIIQKRSMLKKPRQRSLEKRATENPAFLFDLDGTLMDSVYQHVLAWREALEIAGIELSVWRIHRRIGMSGGLFVNALLRETGHQLTKEEAIQLQRLHAKAYGRLVNQVRPLPGARELLAYLSDAKVPWAIATSGRNGWPPSTARWANAAGTRSSPSASCPRGCAKSMW